MVFGSKGIPPLLVNTDLFEIKDTYGADYEEQ